MCVEGWETSWLPQRFLWTWKLFDFLGFSPAVMWSPQTGNRQYFFFLQSQTRQLFSTTDSQMQKKLDGFLSIFFSASTMKNHTTSPMIRTTMQVSEHVHALRWHMRVYSSSQHHCCQPLDQWEIKQFLMDAEWCCPVWLFWNCFNHPTCFLSNSYQTGSFGCSYDSWFDIYLYIYRYTCACVCVLDLLNYILQLYWHFLCAQISHEKPYSEPKHPNI